MKIKKRIKYFLAGLVLFFSTTLPFFAMAQSDVSNGGTSIGISNPFNCGGTSNCTLLTLLTAILNNIIMPVAALACAAWVIWAGFKFVMAKGNPPEITKAKQNLLWALIGVGVILGAAGISAVLQTTVQSFLTK